MEPREHEIHDLLHQAELMEKRAKKRMVLYTAVPLVFAIGLLWFTAYKVNKSYSQLQRVNKELNDVNQELNEARSQKTGLEAQLEKMSTEIETYRSRIGQLEERLERTLDFSRYVHEFDWTAGKYLASRYPRGWDIIHHIMQMKERGVEWRIGGSNESEGFDSPTFAAYVLAQHGKIRDDYLSVRYRLRSVLAPVDRPAPGDVIFYDMGYTMFFFVDHMGRRFCIGMTPVGIVALEMDFSGIVGYGRVDY
jgi:cell wall-associated NlpC family hydrolase